MPETGAPVDGVGWQPLKLLYQRRKGLIFKDIPEPPREVVLFLCGYDAPVVLKSALAAHAFKA